LPAQTVTQKLQKAFQQFESDSQLKHAISSLYVVDAATGKVLFDKNSQVGLAPASTQKIVTAATAFELLGKEYRYRTDLGYTGTIIKDTLVGDLIFRGCGDPTMGSWRYESTKDKLILEKFYSALKEKTIESVSGVISHNYDDFSFVSIPDGWIWQDIGNYYGASADVLNWKENQYDIVLRSGSEIGSEVEIVSPGKIFINELKAAPKGTGDNAYVYFPKIGPSQVVSGTIPINEPSFKISAATFWPTQEFLNDFSGYINMKGITGGKGASRFKKGDALKVIYIHYSPTLDSIIYWFLKKSINLYGEALIKTFAYEKQGFGSTDSGVAIVKKFWKDKGLDEDELNLYDGSGLSPLNRITTHAQVEILKYAKTKDWFPYFYDALPEYNGIKMKSGTISDVKGFCGYHKSKDGKEYIFSFLVNNYSGKTSGVVNKMYKVLDELK
jgi:D-alanyl-D-alanine carboxypeptidase/D-alanyl-D-alanine-endopeptidase (penicillin-binding protein 4)